MFSVSGEILASHEKCKSGANTESNPQEMKLLSSEMEKTKQKLEKVTSEYKEEKMRLQKENEKLLNEKRKLETGSYCTSKMLKLFLILM